MVKLVEHNRIQLECAPGHVRIDGNEMADELARHCSHPLTGPKPALNISEKVMRGGGEMIKDRTSRKHEEYWQSIHG
jgi:hypothetical protein